MPSNWGQDQTASVSQRSTSLVQLRPVLGQLLPWKFRLGKPGADDPLEAIRKRRWSELRVQPLTVDERRRMIADYLSRFGKKLDEHRLVRLAAAAPHKR